MSENEDGFDEIINVNGMDNLQSESDLYNITIRDIMDGVTTLSQCMVFFSSFVSNYLEAITSEVAAEDRPALNIENIVFAKNLFEAAEQCSDAIIEHFHGEVFNEMYYEDGEEEEGYIDDDNDEE